MRLKFQCAYLGAPDNFHLYLNKTNSLLYNVDTYIDSLEYENILDFPYYYNINEIQDSIQLDIKKYIQKLVTGEYENTGFILSTDGINNNFNILHLTKKSKIDILYSK